MAYRTSKENLNREEIKNILKQNLKLYKDEPEFLNYFVDLAIYLVRFKYDEEKSKTDIIQYQPLSKGKQSFITSGSLTDTQAEGGKYCQFCGAVLEGERTCPACGNLNI